MAHLEQNANRAAEVVVFDDPFTSLDSFRRTHTVYHIDRLADVCRQTVVLSHEPTFFKVLWDRIAPADRKARQLGRVGEDNTTIAEWDIDRALQARYRADIEILMRYLSHGEGARMDVFSGFAPCSKDIVEALIRRSLASGR